MKNINDALLLRAQNTCELCSSDKEITIYSLEEPASLEKSFITCSYCLSQIKNTQEIQAQHWRFLSQSMWSEVPSIQAISWKILKFLKNEVWAQELLEQIYLSPRAHEMTETLKEELTQLQDETSPSVHKDSNGKTLTDGDNVTLIKDLVVKGANFTAKRGTLVKNISLSSHPEHIEGRINGTKIVLVTKFLKKV